MFYKSSLQEAPYMRTKWQRNGKQDNMKHINKLATHTPKALIEDILGLMAIFVILTVGLYLPSF